MPVWSERDEINLQLFLQHDAVQKLNWVQLPREPTRPKQGRYEGKTSLNQWERGCTSKIPNSHIGANSDGPESLPILFVISDRPTNQRRVPKSLCLSSVVISLPKRRSKIPKRTSSLRPISLEDVRRVIANGVFLCSFFCDGRFCGWVPWALGNFHEGHRSNLKVVRQLRSLTVKARETKTHRYVHELHVSSRRTRRVLSWTHKQQDMASAHMIGCIRGLYHNDYKDELESHSPLVIRNRELRLL